MKKIIALAALFTSMVACDSPETSVQSESIVTDTTVVDATEPIVDTLSTTEVVTDETATDGAVTE